MVLISGSRRMWAASMAVSLIIFAVLYFTVIRPDNNTAQQLEKSSLQQSQQVIHQAQQQIKNAGATASGASKTASGLSKQGQAALNHAAKLTACLASAGTDPSKLSSCQVKFGG